MDWLIHVKNKSEFNDGIYRDIKGQHQVEKENIVMVPYLHKRKQFTSVDLQNPPKFMLTKPSKRTGLNWKEKWGKLSSQTEQLTQIQKATDKIHNSIDLSRLNKANLNTLDAGSSLANLKSLQKKTGLFRPSQHFKLRLPPGRDPSTTSLSFCQLSTASTKQDVKNLI